MYRVGGVKWSLSASGGVDVGGGGDAAPNNPLYILHYPVESLPLCSRAAAVMLEQRTLPTTHL